MQAGPCSACRGGTVCTGTAAAAAAAAVLCTPRLPQTVPRSESAVGVAGTAAAEAVAAAAAAVAGKVTCPSVAFFPRLVIDPDKTAVCLSPVPLRGTSTGFPRLCSFSFSFTVPCETDAPGFLSEAVDLGSCLLWDKSWLLPWCARSLVDSVPSVDLDSRARSGRVSGDSDLSRLAWRAWPLLPRWRGEEERRLPPVLPRDLDRDLDLERRRELSLDRLRTGESRLRPEGRPAGDGDRVGPRACSVGSGRSRREREQDSLSAAAEESSFRSACCDGCCLS